MCDPAVRNVIASAQPAIREWRFNRWLEQAPNRFAPMESMGPEPMRPDLAVIRDKMQPPDGTAEEARQFRSGANARDFFLPAARRAVR